MAYALTSDQQLELYYYMKLNRELEDSMVKLFRQNKIVGGLYSSLGQEAISVGTAYALEQGDWIAPMIRNIGSLLVRGVPPRDIYTQHMAKVTSPTHGRDGTSHFGDLKVRHIVSPISMLGDLIPVLTGVAMASRYLGQKTVAMTWIGDGGSSTGAFHEGLNLAAVQRAALVLVLENNQWAYSTPVKRQVPIRDLADRARAYGIESMIVDGNDVLAVYRTTKQAVEQARSGLGPVLIEAKTMRMKGHAQHDPAEYVPKEMFEYWKARDPIPRYEKYLMENNLLDQAKIQEIDARIEGLLNEERGFAESSAMPPPEIAEQDVYCHGCHTIEAEWKRPQEEVMPPKSSVRPTYEVQDFGAARVAPGPRKERPATTPVNGAEKVQAVPKEAETTQESATVEEVARVPFGRGPKDRAFREANQNKFRESGSRSFTKGRRPFDNRNQERSGKRPQGRPFDKNSQGKNPQGNSFGRDPQGKQFGGKPQGQRFEGNRQGANGKGFEKNPHGKRGGR